MKILVLDTIHGGKGIGSAFEAAGHSVDTVDVYRNSSVVDVNTAMSRSYDLVVAPVHLDPNHPLLRSGSATVITHHEAVRRLLAGNVPHPMVEVTGKQGKTTTASALAYVLPGPGVLLSSVGIVTCPGQHKLATASITPASVIVASGYARQAGAWLVAEESLGVTGAGDLAILTSGETYPFAAGRKDALREKVSTLRTCRKVLLAPGIVGDLPNAVHVEDVAVTNGTTCSLTLGNERASFSSGLLGLDAYRIPLMLAGTAALILGADPGRLEDFPGIPGRMSVRKEGDRLIIDNSNSGTTTGTTIAAAEFARGKTGSDEIALVIGIETGDGKVCEGFPDREIIRAIETIRPCRLILVGPVLTPPLLPPDLLAGTYIHRVPTLSQGREAALHATDRGSIVLAVKTWR